jgi:hypothetical protein
VLITSSTGKQMFTTNGDAVKTADGRMEMKRVVKE